MKKLFLLMIGAIVMIACEGPVGPPGPQGPEGPGMNWELEFVTIRASDWILSDFNPNKPNEIFYYCTFVPKKFRESNSELRNFIYNDGNIFAYWMSGYDSVNETQIPLPHVLNWTDINGNATVETYSFDYTPEDMRFYVAYSGSNDNYIPGEMTFRIVMNW